jgi:hypothetical protein
MATSEDFEINGKINIDEGGSEGKFTRLQSQIRETTRLLQEAEAQGNTVNFNKYKSQLDDLNDKLEVTTFKQLDFQDAVAAIPGPLGAAGQSVKAFDGALKFLQANPILATLGALVAIFIAIREAMLKTESGTKALNAITTAFGNILTPIIQFISAVAVPIIETFASAINSVAVFFGLVNEEQAKASASLADYTIEIAKANAGIDAHIERLEQQEGTEAQIAALRKARIQNEISLLQMKANTVDKLSAEEQAKLIKLNNDLTVNDLKEAARKKKVREDLNQTLIEINTAFIKDETERAVQERENKYKADLKALNKQLQAEGAANDIRKKFRDELRAIADADEAKIREDKKRSDADYAYETQKDYNEARLKATIEGSEEYLNAQLALEDRAYLRRLDLLRRSLADRKITQDQFDADEANATAAHITTMDALNVASFQMKAQRLFDFGAKVASFLTASAGDNKKQQKTAIRIGEAVAVGEILLNDGIAIRKAYKANPLGFGLPWSAFFAADAILGVMSAHQSANNSISAIDSASNGGSSSAGSSGTTGYSQPSIGAPQIGASLSQTGTIANVIGQTLDQNNSQARPIQAYVIGNQVTTQQQLDRRISAAARLGG